MGERIKINAKKPLSTKENSAPHKQKTDFRSQSSHVDQILFLQRTIGNQAVQQLIKSGTLQAKLSDGAQLQRQEEEPGEEEEEKELQAKSKVGTTPTVTPSIESWINSLKGGGQPLDPATRNFFEPRIGHDFSEVRVHTDNRAADTAQSINARAFTHGRDVVFDSGQYSPGSRSGRSLLAHELTHVVQQNGHQLHRARFQRYQNLEQPTPKEGGQRFLANELLQLPQHSRASSVPQVQRATHASVKKFHKLLRAKFSPSYATKDLLLHGQYSLSVVLYRKLATEFKNAVGKLQVLPSTKRSIIKMFKEILKIIYKGDYDYEVTGYKYAILEVVKLSNAPSVVKRAMRKMLKLPKKFTRYQRFVGGKLNLRLKSNWMKAWKRIKAKRDAFKKGDVSLQNLMKIVTYEGQLCDMIAIRTALVTQSGRRSRRKDAIRFRIRRLRYTKSTVPGSGKGQVLIYDKNNLKYWVKRMKKALDKGHYIRARVSSGVKLDRNYGDHTLLIIGYQGNRFIFWNPAPAENPELRGRRHIYPELKYQSIGYLTYTSTPPRLSTATDDNDMKVDIDGNHKTGVKGRKRYQVITINTI